ncbi:hypothetical protein HDU67_001438 [Dinochytrium kinnereticum]|nr:hypothetical protein HDU67_001438 [Dinochytrium kinnereticum]
MGSLLSSLSSQQQQQPSVVSPIDANWEWVSLPPNPDPTTTPTPNSPPPKEGYLRRRNLKTTSPESRYFLRPPPTQTLISRRITYTPADPFNLSSAGKKGDESRSLLLSIRTVDVESAEDVGIVHRWMNDERVAKFWGEDGPLEHQERYLKTLGWHSVATFICCEGRPFGYLEIYWARPDRFNFYHPKTTTYDRGVHVLLGDATHHGLLPAVTSLILSYIFIDEPRCTMVFGEPRIDNEKFIRNLFWFGFERVAEDAIMPHKRAAMIGFPRRLWEERIQHGWADVVRGVRWDEERARVVGGGKMIV